MIISELIDALQKLKDAHGDLPVASFHGGPMDITQIATSADVQHYELATNGEDLHPDPELLPTRARDHHWLARRARRIAAVAIN